jgi:DDE family transposase
MGWSSQARRGAIQKESFTHYFRADAGFANPDVYEFLEAEGIKYAIRLPANSVLQGRSGYLLARSVGRPPNEVRRYCANFTY